MLFKTKIGKKWDITIPKEVLDDFGLNTGSEMVMVYKENKLIIRKP